MSIKFSLICMFRPCCMSALQRLIIQTIHFGEGMIGLVAQKLGKQFPVINPLPSFFHYFNFLIFSLATCGSALNFSVCLLSTASV